MAMSGHENIGMPSEEEKTTKQIVVSGSIAAAVAGVAAGVLAILSLVNVYPALLAPICAIVIGIAFLLEGGAVASRVARLTLGPGSRDSETIGGGMAMGSLAGVAGVVLGVLALIGIQPITLLACCSIVYGCGVLMESGAIARLNTLILSSSHLEDRTQYYAHEAVNATAGIDILAGFAGIVLGVLSIIGIQPLLLVLVSFICFGCAMLMSGTALTTRLMSALGR